MQFRFYNFKKSFSVSQTRTEEAYTLLVFPLSYAHMLSHEHPWYRKAGLQ